MPTYSSMGVKPINRWFLIGLISQKAILRQKQGNEFADTFVSKNKIVFSQSVESAEDKNTKIVRTNFPDEIVRLKHEQGKNILVGGVSIPSQLIEPVLRSDADTNVLLG
jgi:dihydrofolate reductase